MKKLIDLIQEELVKAFTAAEMDPSYARVSVSNRPDLCEYQCNGAMAAAKAYHKAPIQLAEAVVEKVTDHSVIGEIEAVKPGFINLKINPEFLADYLSKMQNDEELSVEKAKNPKTIIVDYGGANVAKPGEIKAAINYCRTINTPSARMIEKGISRLGRPINDVQVAIENVGNIEVAKLEKGLTVMATISGGAPMLGFLGTVTGMVRAFYEMANAGSGNIDITLLSGGIYEAMITTVGGLIVGIIAMFAYNYLVMLVDRVVNKMESRTMEFMDLLNEPAK